MFLGGRTAGIELIIAALSHDGSLGALPLDRGQVGGHPIDRSVSRVFSSLLQHPRPRGDEAPKVAPHKTGELGESHFLRQQFPIGEFNNSVEGDLHYATHSFKENAGSGNEVSANVTLSTTQLAWFIGGPILVFVNMVILLVIFLAYKRYVFKKKNKWEENFNKMPINAEELSLENADADLFRCAESPHSSFHSFCPWFFWCRVMDTYVTAKIIKPEDTPMVAAWFLICPLWSICMTLPAMRARVRLQLVGDDLERWSDNLVYIFCAPCAASQEARMIDKTAGLETLISFTIRERYIDSEDFIGSPIYVNWNTPTLVPVSRKEDQSPGAISCSSHLLPPRGKKKATLSAEAQEGLWDTNKSVTSADSEKNVFNRNSRDTSRSQAPRFVSRAASLSMLPDLFSNKGEDGGRIDALSSDSDPSNGTGRVAENFTRNSRAVSESLKKIPQDPQEQEVAHLVREDSREDSRRDSREEGALLETNGTQEVFIGTLKSEFFPSELTREETQTLRGFHPDNDVYHSGNPDSASSLSSLTNTISQNETLNTATDGDATKTSRNSAAREQDEGEESTKEKVL